MKLQVVAPALLMGTIAFAATSCSIPTTPGIGDPSPPAPTPAPSVATEPTSPATTTPAPKSERVWPTISGLAGGWIALDGEQMGRDGPESMATLRARLGEPDEQSDSARCGSQPLRNSTYRWGDFSVVVLHEVDSQNEYGETYPLGSVAGWRIDPTMDGRDGLSPNATGPEGTAIGTPLATLEERFQTEEWDDASVSTVRGQRVFSIFKGDTTGAVFELDATARVAAMWAGYRC